VTIDIVKILQNADMFAVYFLDNVVGRCCSLLWLVYIVHRLRIGGISYNALRFYRKQHFENQLLVDTWKVKWEDIEPLRSGKTKDGSTVCVYIYALRQLSHDTMYQEKADL